MLPHQYKCPPNKASCNMSDRREKKQQLISIIVRTDESKTTDQKIRRNKTILTPFRLWHIVVVYSCSFGAAFFCFGICAPYQHLLFFVAFNCFSWLEWFVVYNVSFFSDYYLDFIYMCDIWTSWSILHSTLAMSKAAGRCSNIFIYSFFTCSFIHSFKFVNI